MYYKTNYNSPIGQLTIAAHNNSLIGVWLEGQKYFQGSIKTEFDKWEVIFTINELTKK